MSEVPARPKPDEAWCDMLASYSADELVAGELIEPAQRDFAVRIIRQQANVLLISGCHPNGNPIAD